MTDENKGWSFLGTIIVLIYFVLGVTLFWWSCRIVYWFITGGDFPLPWQPFS